MQVIIAFVCSHPCGSRVNNELVNYPTKTAALAYIRIDVQGILVTNE